MLSRDEQDIEQRSRSELLKRTMRFAEASTRWYSTHVMGPQMADEGKSEHSMTTSSQQERSWYEKIFELFMSMKVEALLVLLAGAMAIMTSGVSYRNTHAQKYKLVVIGANDYDLIGWCCFALTIIGLINIAIGIMKTMRRSRLTFNVYVCLVVMLLICNFCIGMILTEHKNDITNGLEESMMDQLKESVIAKQRFGVGFQLSEAWDFMQMKLMCCGVHTYKDYVDLGGISGITSNAIPVSCCAMKSSFSDLLAMNKMEPDNLNQCQLDARHEVVSSIFLHTQGCYSPISRWLIRHLNKMIAMVFATICLQALGVLYLSWVGFKRSTAYNRK